VCCVTRYYSHLFFRARGIPQRQNFFWSFACRAGVEGTTWDQERGVGEEQIGSVPRLRESYPAICSVKPEPNFRTKSWGTVGTLGLPTEALAFADSACGSGVAAEAPQIEVIGADEI